jgi:hypothetical protein
MADTRESLEMFLFFMLESDIFSDVNDISDFNFAQTDLSLEDLERHFNLQNDRDDKIFGKFPQEAAIQNTKPSSSSSGIERKQENKDIILTNDQDEKRDQAKPG